MSRAKGRAEFGFRPKLHSRAESLSLESLDMSRAKGSATSGFRPKLHSRAESLSLESLDFRDQNLVCPDCRSPQRHSYQTFQNQTLGATMQFVFKSGCGATLGATHVQTF